MSAAMLQRHAAAEPARAAVHEFIEFARTKGIKLVDDSGLVPVEQTVAQVSALIDQQHGIDRAQLAAEHAEQFRSAAACPCGD